MLLNVLIKVDTPKCTIFMTDRDLNMLLMKICYILGARQYLGFFITKALKQKSDRYPSTWPIIFILNGGGNRV